MLPNSVAVVVVAGVTVPFNISVTALISSAALFLPKGVVKGELAAGVGVVARDEVGNRGGVPGGVVREVSDNDQSFCINALLPGRLLAIVGILFDCMGGESFICPDRLLKEAEDGSGGANGKLLGPGIAFPEVIFAQILQVKFCTFRV